ncbi:hypothetical protein K4F52_005394 [Lecanicillium sp. MT-2017a]|nr:hypothetical protein K4F52_005394 [Lecanicillium sp. MT-2017a]
MYAPNITLMPTASPAPFMVERNTTSAPRTKKKKKQPSNTAPTRKSRLSMDEITPAPRIDRLSDDDYDDVQKPDVWGLEEIMLREKRLNAERAEMTAGVQKIEDVTRLWSPMGIVVCWTGMFLVAITLTLDSSTVSSYQPYALSEFQEHSMLPAISTLQNILNAAAKPILAKVADAAGRAEAISLGVLSITIGFVINATSQNLGGLSAGQVFYSFGQTGITFLQQILAADTTTLANRSLLGGLLYSPFVFTSWAGAAIVEALVPVRGYGMWAIVLPATSIPLLASLYWHQHRAKKLSTTSQVKHRLRTIVAQADIVGLFLFLAGLVLVLLPMTLATRFHSTWSSPQVISMLVIGGTCFVAFVVYELYVPRYPILSLRLAKSRTVAAGCITEAFFFLSYYIWQPYFYSFIVVVNDLSPKAATNIVISQGVSTTVIGIAGALVVKFTGNCKWVIVAGTVIKMIGGGLMLAYSDPDATLVQILFGQLVSGGGSGMISVVAQTAVQAAAKHQDIASVTTLYEVARALGGAVGNAISGAIWTNLLLSRLQQHLPEAAQSNAAAIKNSFTIATSYKTGTAERIAINQCYTEVMHILLVISMVFLVLSFLAALAIENVDVRKIDAEAGADAGNIIGTIKANALGNDTGESRVWWYKKLFMWRQWKE